MAVSAVAADVCLSDAFDAVLVTPVTAYERPSLISLLRKHFTSIRFQREYAGVRVAFSQAGQLLELRDGLEFRWSDDARRAVENRTNAVLHQADLASALEVINSSNRSEVLQTLADIPNLASLDDHQVANVASMAMQSGYGLCIFDEQGAGKTVTGIFGHDVLVRRSEVTFLLIVAPKSMVPEWQEAYHQFQPGRYKVAIASGTREQKRRTFAMRPDVLVANYETIVSMEAEIRTLIRRHNGHAMLIVDESFLAKNLDTKRTRAIRRLREHCGRAFVLCGTPAPNAPHDVVQQFNIVDFGTTFEGVVIPEDRQAAIPVVQRALSERGLYVRHLKSEVLPHLPEKQYHRVKVPLEPVQRRLYSGALQDLILDLQSVDDRSFRRKLTSFMARRSALLQICSNPSAVAEGYTETPAKILALDMLLEHTIVQCDEKVVLWSFYTSSINAIMTRYGKYNPVRYDGQVADIHKRRAAVQRFQDDDITMLFVGNPAAAGAGLTLHRAHVAVYESMSNQAAHYLQSVDRIHRRGQDREAEYTILLCEGTIEVSEYARLVRKEQDAQLLLGDQVTPPLTRESMLAEALEARSLLGVTSGSLSRTI